MKKILLAVLLTLTMLGPSSAAADQNELTRSPSGVLAPTHVWKFALEHELFIVREKAQVYGKYGCDTIFVYPIVSKDGRYYGAAVHAMGSDGDERLVLVIIHDREETAPALDWSDPKDYAALEACHAGNYELRSI